MNTRILHPFMFLALPAALAAQDIGDRDILLQEIAIPGMPGLQSFAWGQYDGQWFLIGGRTDGLHRRQPPFSFLAADNNTSAFVVDPVTQQVWSASINSLPVQLVEQLQSTNMEFEQRGATLYCAGGYGYSSSSQDHITFPYLTAIDLPGVMDAIRNGGPISEHFRWIEDPRMEVTGGQMRSLDDRFYLVGGQRFIGRYNPMGPDFGPGFIQEYTNAIRRFAIDDDGLDLAVSDYWTRVDTVNLHRRDYNMLPQIFPDGSAGFTAFTGVFQYADDLPWLNTVDIVDTDHVVVPGFEQLLNQYHSAHASLHQASANMMHSLFFGGIARYYFDGNGTLWDDPNVPFVNTISRVTRAGDGTMQESAVGTMPALLGASAEFIPWPATPQDERAIFNMDQFVGDTVVLGHVVGGIQSSAPNIFFSNTGIESDATTRVFRVLLVDAGVTAVPPSDDGGPRLSAILQGDQLVINVQLPAHALRSIRLIDTTGRVVRSVFDGSALNVDRTFVEQVADLAPGAYTVEVVTDGHRYTRRFMR